ncbi:WxL domain-containing protein [Lapidilactobacillus salsurivasis]
MKKMNQTKLVALALAVLLTGSGVAIGTTRAADEGTTNESTLTGNSVGEFEVTGGALNLASVPDMRFASVTVSDLLTNETTTAAYQNAEVTKDGAKKSDALTVEDYRGTGDSDWKVTAKLGAFTNAGADSIEGSIKYQGNNAASGSSISATETDVWSGANATTNGSGHVTATTTADETSLTLSKSKGTVLTGSYDADITWTLSNTAATSAE